MRVLIAAKKASKIEKCGHGVKKDRQIETFSFRLAVPE